MPSYTTPLATGPTPLFLSEECYFATITRVPCGQQLGNCLCIDHVASDGCVHEVSLRLLILPSDHAALFAALLIPRQTYARFKKSTWTCINPAAAKEYAAQHIPQIFKDCSALMNFIIRFQDMFADKRSCQLRRKYREPLVVKELRRQCRETTSRRDLKQFAIKFFL